jgi:hypothetical protein
MAPAPHHVVTLSVSEGSPGEADPRQRMLVLMEIQVGLWPKRSRSASLHCAQGFFADAQNDDMSYGSIE